MLKKSKVITGTIVDCLEVDVLDTPEEGASIICQFEAGKKVQILTKPNKNFYGIQVSPSIVGFIAKEFVKVD